MIGLLPAAGNATRIHGLPKYLLPVPGGYLLQQHIQGMQAMGCSLIMTMVNDTNAKILECVTPSVNLYTAEHHDTMTQTVLSALDCMGEHRQNEPILFAMPDTYWQSPHVYLLLKRAVEDGADVAVALFKSRPKQHTQGGMCRIEGTQVTEVIDKPAQSDLQYIWSALAWSPVFWSHLHPNDPHVGYGLSRAITAGLDVRAVVCEGEFWDCGTPERYFECIRALEGEGAYG